MDVPQYVGETRFYRKYLRISYEHGRALREIGAISIDAKMDDGRPLFLLDDEAIGRHQAEVKRHRANLRQAQENVATYG
jgi:hypothetical protein